MILGPFEVLIRGDGVNFVVLLFRMPAVSKEIDAGVVRLPAGLPGYLLGIGSDL